jgi:hypothetical protein
LEQFESLFNAADLCALRRRVLQDVRIQLMPSPWKNRQGEAGAKKKGK